MSYLKVTDQSPKVINETCALVPTVCLFPTISIQTGHKGNLSALRKDLEESLYFHEYELTHIMKWQSGKLGHLSIILCLLIRHILAPHG